MNLKMWFKLLRVKQYVKNFLLFVPLVFGKPVEEWIFLFPKVLLAFILFSLASSSIYIINDIKDREKDRLHPVKSKRPIASGKIGVNTALAIAIILLIVSVLGAWFLNKTFAITLVLYLVNNLLYSFVLKSYQLLDVFSIAFGFVLRVYAGAAVINVPVSTYLFLTIFFLALFLGFGKRRYEILTLKADKERHRASLRDYTVYYLDQLMTISATLALVVYTIYVVEHTNKIMVFTVPVVVFGLFRYYHITHNLRRGEPSDDLLSDPGILAASAFIYGILILLSRVL